MPDRTPVERITNIDAYRTIAILLVICLHTNFIGKLHELGHGRFLIDVTLYQIWWISVPYFFLAAGYFFGKQAQSGQAPLALLSTYSLPLLRIFAISLFLYCIIPRDWIRLFARHGVTETVSTQVMASLSRLANEHIELLLVPQPPVFHLWFLPALVIGLAAVAAVLVLRWEKWVAAIILGLYGLSVLEEVAALHLYPLYDFRLWLMPALFALLGWRISIGGPFGSIRPLGLIAGGYVLAVIEGVVIAKGFHGTAVAVRDHSYAGGILMVAGLFLLTLTRPAVGRGMAFSFLAKWVLGIYVFHMLVLDAFEPFLIETARTSALWDLIFVIAVYAMSLGLTLVLAHTPVLRYAVMRQGRNRAVS
ncbi:MAG: acyltransferase family protein [Nitrospiraceae bacterium]